MTVSIHLKDLLEPRVADESFTDAVEAINMSAARGKTLMVMDKPGGGHMAINIPNINVIDEMED